MKKPRISCLAAAIVFVAAMLLMSGCSAKEAENYKVLYQDYVKSLLDTTYFGDYSKYMEMTGADEEQSEAIYSLNVKTLTESLQENCSIEMGMVSAEISERLDAVVKQVLAKAKYTVSEGQRDGDSIFVTVKVEPMDYLVIVSNDMDDYMDEFNARSMDGEFEDFTEEEFEEEYAQGVLSVLEAAVDKISYQPEVSKKVVIQYDEENEINYIEDADLDEIHRKILMEAK